MLNKSFKMAEYRGSYYSEGSTFREIASLPVTAFNAGKNYYEVLRVINGHCLFLKDHLLRLQKSVSLAELDYEFIIQDVAAVIRGLIRKNGIINGNIRLVLQVKEGGSPVLYTYCIPHAYPSPDDYDKGVPTAVFNFVRSNPNIKQYNHAYKQQVAEFIANNNIYEALLRDDRDCITEGSKSNVFFVARECIMTAPGDQVLKGITREKVFLLCKNLNYKIIESPISINTLSRMEAVFLTGTSPKILPVNRVDEIPFSTANERMRNLMAAYDDLIVNEFSSGSA